MKTNYKKPRLNSILLIFLIAVFVSSCTERIDIDLDESYTRLVVEGEITTDSMAHTIRLSKTSSYYYSETAPGVSDAIVSINDGESEITLTQTEAGIYQTPEDYAGIPGRTYTLNISLTTPINGYDTYSARSYMNSIINLDSIQAVYNEDWGESGFYELKCYVLDPPTTDFYMFKVLKNGELLTDTLRNVLITDDRFYNGNYTNGIGVGFLNQAKSREKVNPGDQLTVQSSKITREYYEFVTQLQIQSGYQNPLFSGPPSNVTGNINNGGIGFFTAYPVSYSSTVVSTE